MKEEQVSSRIRRDQQKTQQLSKNGDNQEQSTFLTHSNAINKQKYSTYQIQKGQRPNNQQNNNQNLQCSLPIILLFILVFLFGIIVSRYMNFQINQNINQNPNSPQFNTLKQIYQISKTNLIHSHMGQQIVNSDNKNINSKNPIDQNNYNHKKTNQQKLTDKNQQQKYKLLKQQAFQTLWMVNSELGYKKDYINNVMHYSSAKSITIKLIEFQQINKLINNKKIIDLLQKMNNLQNNENLYLNDNKKNQDIKEIKRKIIQPIIMLELLYEEGGMAINGDFILTQQIQQILQSIKEKTQNINYQLFLFAQQQFQTNKIQFQFDLNNYFIIATKQSKILLEFINQLVKILSKLVQSKTNIGQINYQSLIDSYQTSISSLVSKKYQSFLKSYQQLNEPYLIKDKFLQSIKLYHIANLTQLNIAQSYLLNLSSPSHFNYLAYYQQDFLQQLMGPINSIVHLPSNSYQLFLQHLKTSPSFNILQNSFLYQYMFKFTNQHRMIIPFELQKSNQPKKDEQKISSFPKIIWTFIPREQQQVLNIHDYFINNLIWISKQQNYKLLVLNQDNIQTVLNGKQLHEIYSNFKNEKIQEKQKIKQNQQIFNLLIKLEILKKYGGIFLDFGYFLIQNLNWFTNLNNNHHLFNNYDHQPDVFMFHNHTQFEWNLNINSGFKQAKQLQYLTYFIGSAKNSSLINNWLQYLIQSLKNNNQPENRRNQCVKKYGSQKDIGFRSLRCMLQQKQKEYLQKSLNYISSSKEYKIWSINSLLGGNKMDMVMKGQNRECFDIKDSYSKFRQKYGSMGYVSSLRIEGLKRNIDQIVRGIQKDSIFIKFFKDDEKMNRKQIQQKKSIKYIDQEYKKIKNNQI